MRSLNYTVNTGDWISTKSFYWWRHHIKIYIFLDSSECVDWTQTNTTQKVKPNNILKVIFWTNQILRIIFLGQSDFRVYFFVPILIGFMFLADQILRLIFSWKMGVCPRGWPVMSTNILLNFLTKRWWHSGTLFAIRSR